MRYYRFCVPFLLIPLTLAAGAAGADEPTGKQIEAGRRPLNRISRPAGFAARIQRIPILRVLDANLDGTLSAAEIDAAATSLRKLDRNGDGELDRREWFAGQDFMPPESRRGAGRGKGGLGDRRPADREQRITRLFQARDRDGDGVLRGEEIPAAMQRLLGRMDRNSDGGLEKSEMQQAARQLKRRVDAEAAEGDGSAVQPKRPPFPDP